MVNVDHCLLTTEELQNSEVKEVGDIVTVNYKYHLQRF